MITYNLIRMRYNRDHLSRGQDVEETNTATTSQLNQNKMQPNRIRSREKHPSREDALKKQPTPAK